MKSKDIIIALILTLVVLIVGLYFIVQKQKEKINVHAKCTTTYCSM